MKIAADKSKEEQQSRASANQVAQQPKRQGVSLAPPEIRSFAFEKTRPEAFAQRMERIFGRRVQARMEEKGVFQMTPEAASIQRQAMPEEEKPLPEKFEPLPRQENKTGLPDRLKTGIESLSGLDLSDVRVHRNSSKPAQLQALAYTQGTEIHVGPGQERHLPHEAWHAVQQKQGRVKPTMQAKGVAINDDQGLEKEADVMGARSAQTYAQVEKAKENKSRTVGNAVSQKQTGREATFQFVDNRVETVAQRKLGLIIEKGDQDKCAEQLQMRSEKDNITLNHHVDDPPIQLVPISDDNPKRDLLYRNFRFLLSEMIELKRDGEPKNDRQELFLGLKYKSEAEEIFSGMWLVSNDFEYLQTQLWFHLKAELGDHPEERIKGLERDIEGWKKRGETARSLELQQHPISISEERGYKRDLGESEELKRPELAVDDWWTTCKYACVRAASEAGAGGWSYQLADFLPTGHPFRGDAMAITVGSSEYVTKDVWMARMKYAANMIAMAARNSEATRAAFFKKATAYGAERIFDTHTELKIPRMAETASLRMSTQTTSGEVEVFILKQLGL